VRDWLLGIAIGGIPDEPRIYKYTQPYRKIGYNPHFLYSSVPRNINGLYSSVLKPTNIGATDEHRAGTFVG
jgi:hypothetical protein